MNHVVKMVKMVKMRHGFDVDVIGVFSSSFCQMIWALMTRSLIGMTVWHQGYMLC